MRPSSTSPFINDEPLDPKLHDGIITRHSLIKDLLERIRARDYCTLLGPKNSGRTTTLHLVAHALAEDGEHAPVYVDPRMLDLTDEAGFLLSLRNRIRDELESQGFADQLRSVTTLGSHHVDSFAPFLRELTGKARLQPVILFDEIENVPPNLLTRLLHIAASLHNSRERQSSLKNLVFVFAGYISLRYLTTYENPKVSPFYICTDFIIRDLTRSEALQFLQEVGERFELQFRYEALNAILDYAGGDLNTIQTLAGLALNLADGGEVEQETVELAVAHLLEAAESGEDETLLMMALEIEEDQSTFDLVVGMLREEDRTFNPARFTDALFHEFSFTYPEMTGALTLLRRYGTPVEWSFRNAITRRFLEAHFTPARVVRTYTALGKFDKAIARCGPLLDQIRTEFQQHVSGIDNQHLNDVIIAMTNRIYAVGSHEAAFELISLLLREAFGCAEIVYYDYRMSEHSLYAVRFLSGLFANDGTQLKVDADHERLEVRAYKSKMFAVSRHPDSSIRVAIPVENMQGEVTAVVAFTPRLLHESGLYLNSRMHVVQRALRWINFALNRLEHDSKSRIIEAASHIAGPAQTTRVFVAHKFSSELLFNLRDQLGRVAPSFSFEYLKENVGLLNSAIHGEMRATNLGLYEMSQPNCNVYYELGYGIGINLPGLMFIRKSPERLEARPPLLRGILHLEYEDYSGLVEGISQRLEEVLRRYVNRPSNRYLHFLGTEIPRTQRLRSHLVVVLDHGYFGDRRDYRAAVEAGLADQGMIPVYPLDGDFDAYRYVRGASTGRRLLDLYLLIKHADQVICRCEEVSASAAAAQVFIGLGIAHGLSRPVRLTRLEKDSNGVDLGIPEDLGGLTMLEYSRLADLQNQLATRL